MVGSLHAALRLREWGLASIPARGGRIGHLAYCARDAVNLARGRVVARGVPRAAAGG
jgi:hypothetical protein